MDDGAISQELVKINLQTEFASIALQSESSSLARDGADWYLAGASEDHVFCANKFCINCDFVCIYSQRLPGSWMMALM